MESPALPRQTNRLWPYGQLAATMLALPALVAPLIYLVVRILPPPSDAERLQRALLLAIGFSLVWALTLLWYFNRISVAADHLQDAVQRVSTGDLGSMHREAMPTPFLGELQNSLGEMVDRLQQARHALDKQMREERAIRQELQDLQRQVIRQERLAAVGLLVSGVAHEINNPLQSILGFSELLQMEQTLPEQVRRDLEVIQRESLRACNIIRNLAKFARQQPGESLPVALSDVITSVCELRQRRLATEQITLTVESRSLRQVMAVFTELQQVLLNFVVNAEQVILSSGRFPGQITIRTWDDGTVVRLEVEDSGPGVDPEDEPKLFQPFFTTKAVGEGTGLGLSVSYGIIDSLGGKMGYRKGDGGGAVFYFELPARIA